MEYIVDIQSFKIPSNEFAVKELAIISLEYDVEPIVYTFKEPYDWENLPVKYKVENTWIERHHLHMKWSDGDLPYDEIKKILHSHLHSARNVYVKGLEKVLWLCKYLNNVSEIDEKCPKLKFMRQWKASNLYCKYHYNPDMACAARHVLLLKHYFRINRLSPERSIIIFNKTKHLSFMKTEDIAQLPKEFIIKHASESIDTAWNKLPANFKNDVNILMCLKCRIHDHGDKYVIPMIKECDECLLYK